MPQAVLRDGTQMHNAASFRVENPLVVESPDSALEGCLISLRNRRSAKFEAFANLQITTSL